MTGTPANERAQLTDADLDAIRRRNRNLAAIPFEPHNGREHGDNCPPCNLVRGIGDVSKLLAIVDQLRPVGQWRKVGDDDGQR